MPTRRSILEAAGGLLLGSVIREIRAVPPPARVLEIHSGYGQEADRVGHPPRPGALRFDYFTTQRHRLPMPPAAQRSFPGIEEIVSRRVAPPTTLSFSG